MDVGDKIVFNPDNLPEPQGVNRDRQQEIIDRFQDIGKVELEIVEVLKPYEFLTETEANELLDSFDVDMENGERGQWQSFLMDAGEHERIVTRRVDGKTGQHIKLYSSWPLNKQVKPVLEDV
jgi:hypothetical protein